MLVYFGAKSILSLTHTHVFVHAFFVFECLGSNIWNGKCRVVAKGDACEVMLEDKDSGALFASCVVKDGSVERVEDSRRYFVLRIEDGSGLCVCVCVRLCACVTICLGYAESIFLFVQTFRQACVHWSWIRSTK